MLVSLEVDFKEFFFVEIFSYKLVDLKSGIVMAEKKKKKKEKMKDDCKEGRTQEQTEERWTVKKKKNVYLQIYRSVNFRTFIRKKKRVNFRTSEGHACSKLFKAISWIKENKYLPTKKKEDIIRFFYELQFYLYNH